MLQVVELFRKLHNFAKFQISYLNSMIFSDTQSGLWCNYSQIVLFYLFSSLLSSYVRYFWRLRRRRIVARDPWERTGLYGISASEGTGTVHSSTVSENRQPRFVNFLIFFQGIVVACCQISPDSEFKTKLSGRLTFLSAWCQFCRVLLATYASVLDLESLYRVL